MCLQFVILSQQVQENWCIFSVLKNLEWITILVYQKTNDK